MTQCQYNYRPGLDFNTCFFLISESAKTGKLKISRINKCSGSCKGGDEIWMLVEKINKSKTFRLNQQKESFSERTFELFKNCQIIAEGLIVRFWEECNGKLIWQSCLEGDDIILHHQYAIIFKTPAYREVNTMSEVEVLMRLERTTQPNQPCDFSEPITFVYEPLKCKLSKGDLWNT